MGWEIRRGKRVYYRKERYRDAEGRSRVRSVYCGPGERGERAAREDEERRQRQDTTPAIVARVQALREVARAPESFEPHAVRPVEPPRPSPWPAPTSAPMPAPLPFPKPRPAPRLRGVAAWRAMGRLTRR